MKHILDLPKFVTEKLSNTEVHLLKTEYLLTSATIERETEKAVLIKQGSVSVWCPKSILAKEDLEEKPVDAEKSAMVNKAEKYATYLENLALENGIKEPVKVLGNVGGANKYYIDALTKLGISFLKYTEFEA